MCPFPRWMAASSRVEGSNIISLPPHGWWSPQRMCRIGSSVLDSVAGRLDIQPRSVGGHAAGPMATLVVCPVHMEAGWHQPSPVILSPWVCLASSVVDAFRWCPLVTQRSSSIMPSPKACSLAVSSDLLLPHLLIVLFLGPQGASQTIDHCSRIHRCPNLSILMHSLLSIQSGWRGTPPEALSVGRFPLIDRGSVIKGCTSLHLALSPWDTCSGALSHHVRNPATTLCGQITWRDTSRQRERTKEHRLFWPPAGCVSSPGARHVSERACRWFQPPAPAPMRWICLGGEFSLFENLAIFIIKTWARSSALSALQLQEMRVSNLYGAKETLWLS